MIERSGVKKSKKPKWLQIAMRWIVVFLFSILFHGRKKYYEQIIRELKTEKIIIIDTLTHVRKDKNKTIDKCKNYLWAKDRGFKARFKGRRL